MALPAHLKKLPIWTLSDTNKRPLDLHHLFTHNAELLHSPGRGSKLYTYAACKKVQTLHPHTLLTIRPRTEDTVTLLDVEPKGVEIDPNPYTHMKVDYLEYSMSGGLHGIILDRIDGVPDIFKDEKYQTELFKSNHFMIITENEIENPKPGDFYLNDYKTRILELTAHDVEMEYTFDPDAMVTDIDTDTQYRIKSVFVKPFQDNSNDASRNEYRYGVYLAGKLMREFQYDNINTLISHLLFFAEFHLPYREKHKKVANYSDYGTLPWRHYTLIQGAEYIFNAESDKRDA